MPKTVCAWLTALVGFLYLTPAANALDFSFTGTFAGDDDVQLFNFTVGAPSANVVLRTFSYAGGTPASGPVVLAGGFDPILALFDATTGSIVDFNDDGAPGTVDADPTTGRAFDTYFARSLDAGNYIVAVSQYDNFAVARASLMDSSLPVGNLADGFELTGDPFFTVAFSDPMSPCTQFCDVDGHIRTSAWAFDILNVESASVVPVPAALPLLLSGVVGLGFLGFRRRVKTSP
jgi:hypothetical protein